MSGLTIDELIGALQIQRKQMGGDAPVVVQCRLTGIGSRGIVEYRYLTHLVRLYPDKAGKQALNAVGNSHDVYRRFIDGKEVLCTS